jgi:hypothetical protein
MKSWKWFKVALIFLLIAFIAGWYVPTANANQKDVELNQAIVDTIILVKYGQYVLTKTGSCLMTQVTVMQVDDPEGRYKYWYFNGEEAYRNVNVLERNAWLVLDAIQRDYCV